MDTSKEPRIWELSETSFVLDLNCLFERFGQVHDLRKARGKRYPLWALLIVAVLAKLAGQQHPEAIAQWAHLRAKPLCRLLGLIRHKMPVLRTWQRVFSQGLSADELDQIVCEYLIETFTAAPQDGVLCAAIDGKTLRGTISTKNPQGVHLLAIYLPERGVVLAQTEIGSKANEISASPQLVRQVDLQGIVLTGDAMFTQRTLSMVIVETGGNYLWDVKANQPQLMDDIATLFEDPGDAAISAECLETSVTSQGHGRSEKRTLTCSSLLKGYSEFPHLEQVFQIETEVTNLSTGKMNAYLRYGATSLSADRASPDDLLNYVRQHWGIESGLHYRRDVTLGEDRIRPRLDQVAHVHAILNNLLIALLHKSPISLAHGLRCAAYQVERLLWSINLT